MTCFQRLARLLPIFAPLFGRNPSDLLLRHTARLQWRFIALNFGSSLVEALSEGATLGVIFLAVEVLSISGSKSFDWTLNPLATWWPSAAAWLNTLQPSGVFVSLLVIAVLLQALQSFARFLGLISLGYFTARCRALVTLRIHSQVLSFSFPCASSYKVGDLVDYSLQAPEAIRKQIEVSSRLIVGSLLIATYLSVLVRLSPWLLLAVALMGGLVSLLQKRLVPRIRAGSQAVSRVQVAISSRITEDFQALRVLHSNGQLDQADERLRSGMGELEHLLRAQALRLAVVGPFTSFLPILTFAIIAALSLLLLGGRSTGVLPSLVTFVLALQRLNTRLISIVDDANLLADNAGGLERLNQILSPTGKQFRSTGGVPFSALQKGIRFDRVELRYSQDLPPALEDISFNLPKGKMLALVGESGAGKSSIADLLTGLYQPSAGQIWIDGQSLEHFNLDSWQQRLGVVSQDTFLFNATIADNVALGTPKVTLDQIKAACQLAQAAGFIECLPDAYSTLVGERGYRLSGGQRQRLSLARAILRDPELLILDEATSALDSQSEKLVQEAIERFEHNHTVLVIAHRLSTIARADQILVLEAGQVVQRGTHNSLLSEEGLYQQLWQQQSNAGKSVFT